KALAPLARKVSMSVGHALVRLVNDAGGLQLLQVDLLDEETADDVEHFQTYGLTGRPKPGAAGIFLSVMGSRGDGVVIAVDDRRYRLRGLEEGEVALYDDLGQVVHLKRDGVRIASALKVTVEAPQVVVLSDDVNLGGTGGQRVARIGDAVAGGVITGGSAKVRAA